MSLLRKIADKFNGATPPSAAIMNVGDMRIFYHDALMTAAHENNRASFDLLIGAGAMVGRDHIEITQNMAIVYGEPGPEGEPSATQGYSEQLGRGLDMLKAAFKTQEEKRALDAENAKMPGPLALGGSISVRGPLKLKVPVRRGFAAEYQPQS